MKVRRGMYGSMLFPNAVCLRECRHDSGLNYCSLQQTTPRAFHTRLKERKKRLEAWLEGIV